MSSKTAPRRGGSSAASDSTGNRAAPVISDRSWLARAAASSSEERADRERLARALGRATVKWEEAKRYEGEEERGRKKEDQ